MRNIFSAVMAITALLYCSTSWGGNYKDTLTEMEFVLVKGGCFQMGHIFGDGYEDSRPLHKVCVGDFYIGKYEVTQGQWKAIMEKNPSVFKNCGNDCPLEAVSWDDAKEFIDLLNKKSGKKYRLPFEAEWEYAARSGGRNEKWSGTSDENELTDYAWYAENSGGKTHPVGKKKPNGLGIYDMSGNVWEWMEDKRHESYVTIPDIKDAKSGTWEYCVLRGGSWNDSSRGLRFAARNVSRAIETDLTIGFRLAFQAQKEDKK